MYGLFREEYDEKQLCLSRNVPKPLLIISKIIAKDMFKRLG